MNQPFVSVIVPTKNSAKTLDASLSSIREQTYPNIELIVVDNFSTDTTQEIAKKYTEKVFAKGPERCAQRNYGAKQSSGEFLVFIDSDMNLSPEVIKSCVERMGTGVIGVIIPEESFGDGFWAQCKKLERSFYVGVDWMEAARFFSRGVFEKVEGYDEKMVSGEDWDLSQRINELGPLARINNYIYHNEGRISLWKTIKKKYYYAKEFSNYTSANTQNANLKRQTSILERYALFFSKPNKLLVNPVLGLSMLFMKTSELVFGGFGYMVGKLKKI